MPASTIVASSGEFRLYGNSVQTFDTLPVATYVIAFDRMTGYSLHQTEPLAAPSETVYGSHAVRVSRIVTGYAAMDRSLGVILSGDKGMGKSLMIRMLAERMREECQLPTVLVRHSTPGLAAFLDELGEVVVVFDEFEKVFSGDDNDDNAQNQFLSLFDGLSTTKRLYVLSVNELGRVSDYMINRPGRFHYHMRFTYPEAETVATYLRDQVPGVAEKQVAEIVDFSRKYDINFDHLRAIAFELNLGGVFADVVGDLNIKRTGNTSSRTEARVFWEDGSDTTLTGRIDLFNDDDVQGITDWDAGYVLRFRMGDALPAEGGYRLPDGAFTISAINEPDDGAEGDEEEEPRATAVVLRRVPRTSIDF